MVSGLSSVLTIYPKRSICGLSLSSIAMHWMPEILYRFRRLCPKANVDLRMVDHALEPFELLESGQIDVIFSLGLFNTPVAGMSRPSMIVVDEFDVIILVLVA